MTSYSLYRKLLMICPADFRRRFGDEMAGIFSDMCRDASERAGLPAVTLLFARAMADLVCTALAERADSIRARTAGLRLPAVALAGLTAWFETHCPEVQPVAVCVALSVFTLTSLRPAAAALWILAIGFSVPAVHLAIRIFPVALPYPDPRFISTFLALIPAVIGGVSAGAARKLFVRNRQSDAAL